MYKEVMIRKKSDLGPHAEQDISHPLQGRGGSNAVAELLEDRGVDDSRVDGVDDHPGLFESSGEAVGGHQGAHFRVWVHQVLGQESEVGQLGRGVEGVDAQVVGEGRSRGHEDYPARGWLFQQTYDTRKRLLQRIFVRQTAPYNKQPGQSAILLTAFIWKPPLTKKNWAQLSYK